MRIAFGIVLAVHALIHLMGFAKAYELARLTQLALPISRTMGLLWLAAASLLVAATVALFAMPRWFWLLGALGMLASQTVILASWADARFGTIPNILTLIAVVYGAFAWGPFGLRAEYTGRTSLALAQLAETPPVTEAELSRLPEPLQRYLRYVGVVGQPHVRGFRARFTGRIRSAPDAPWMAFHGEQHSFVDPPTRLFFMEATMRGLPVDALHVYAEGDARMRVKVLSLVPVVDASGPAFTRAETVTLFNDMCIMAPAALVDASIRWNALDARSVEATYTQGPHSIRATLVFDDTGALVNFWSDDRPALAPDGVSFVPLRWSTPVGDYRAQGPFRLASRGEARYAAASGEYAYIQFDSLNVSYDLQRQ
jgi:hypothetical protein